MTRRNQALQQKLEELTKEIKVLETKFDTLISERSAVADKLASVIFGEKLSSSLSRFEPGNPGKTVTFVDLLNNKTSISCAVSSPTDTLEDVKPYLIKQLWERGETKTRHISFSSMKENTRLSSLFLDIPFMVVDKILD